MYISLFTFSQYLLYRIQISMTIYAISKTLYVRMYQLNFYSFPLRYFIYVFNLIL